MCVCARVCVSGGLPDSVLGGPLLLQPGGSAGVPVLQPGHHTPQPETQLHDPPGAGGTAQPAQVKSPTDTTMTNPDPVPVLHIFSSA